MEQACHELGVQRGASEADIKSAYRKLVLQYHPDRHVNSSPTEAAAAAHRFKVITEAYDVLTNPNERLHSSYGASTSTASSRAYHYNVNTDWSHYESGSAGHTSTINRWDWWKRAARHGTRNLGHTLHLSLAMLLIGGGVMFELSHSALWAARNKGKSFEEMQAAVRAKQAAAEAAAGGASSAVDAEGGGRSSEQHQQQQVYHIRSSWADGMRGRFVDPSADDPVAPSEHRHPPAAAPAGPASST